MLTDRMLSLQVGAGILAIPAVTQESGFLASAVTCIGCWAFMVIFAISFLVFSKSVSFLHFLIVIIIIK